MLGAQVGELAMPYYIGVVIDMLGKGDIDGVAEISGYMAILLIASGLSVGMRTAVFQILSERISRNLRQDYF